MTDMRHLIALAEASVKHRPWVAFDAVTPELIRAVFREDADLLEYAETVSDHNGKDVEEWLAGDWVPEELDRVRGYFGKVKNAPQIALYRGMDRFPDPGIGLGSHWSMNKDVTVDFGHIRLHGSAKQEQIDWASTLARMIAFEDISEAEIVLMPGSEIALHKITFTHGGDDAPLMIHV